VTVIFMIWYSSPNIRLAKSRRMRRNGYVARVRDKRNACRVFVRKPKGKNNLEYLGLDWRIILNKTFEKWYEMAWTGLLSLGKRTGDRLLLTR
jgi:hypothetical protein